jgi:hypothetical protein
MPFHFSYKDKLCNFPQCVFSRPVIFPDTSLGLLWLLELSGITCPTTYFFFGCQRGRVESIPTPKTHFGVSEPIDIVGHQKLTMAPRVL